MSRSAAYAVRDTILWVEDTGETDLPVLLCLHSLFLDGTMFGALQDAAKNQFRVVCPDFRGQGCSAPAAERSITMDDCADDMFALIESMGLDGIHLIGASMGGDVAARMAARKPELFKSLVFMGSSVRGEPVEQAEQFSAWLESCAEIGFVGENLALLNSIMFGETTRGRNDFESKFSPWLGKLSLIRSALWPAMIGVLERPSAADELSSISAPTLVFSGADDFARPPVWGKELADGISGARQVVLEGVGHSPVLEAPETVVPATLQFIKEAIHT